MTPVLRRRAAVAIGGTALAVMLLLPILATGIPAYVHDWLWPPDPAGLRAHLLEGWSAWIDDGVGNPNPYPTALPHYVVLAWLSAFVPSRVLLAVLLIATFAFAFAGAYAFARRTFALRAGAVAAAVLYAAAPLALTELIAGHLSHLQAYAAFPYLALALREAPRSLRWTGIGALAVAVTALQVQFLAFDALYAAIAVALGAATLRGACKVALLALPACIPVLLGPTFNVHGESGVFALQHALVSWEIEQSAPPLDALMGAGYFTSYVERLEPPYAIYGLLLVTMCAAYAVVREARASRAARALAVCAVAGWLLVIGLRGPLAPLAAWSFENITAVSVFREIFNVMVLFWFPVSVLAGLGLERVPRRVAIAGGAVVAAVLVVPWARYGSYFTPAPQPAVLGALAGIVAADERGASGDPARIVWWPAPQPIGPPGRDQGGSDPLAQSRLGTARPLYEYQPVGAFGRAVALATADRWDEATTVLGWLGVRYVVTRDGVVSYASGRPRASAPPAGTQLRQIGDAGGFRVYRVAQPRPLVGVEPDVPGDDLVATPFAASRLQATPAPGLLVAAFPSLWRDPAVADCGPHAVLGDAATLAARGGPWIFAAPPSADRCTWRTAAALSAAGSTLYVAGGWSTAPQARTNLPARPLAVPSSVTASEGRWRAQVHVPRSGLLVVRTSFDGRWRASVDGRDAGPPRRWNGFVAWPIGPGDHAVDVRFGGELPIRAALIVALAGLVASAVLAALPGRAAQAM